MLSKKIKKKKVIFIDPSAGVNIHICLHFLVFCHQSHVILEGDLMSVITFHFEKVIFMLIHSQMVTWGAGL